MGDGVRQLHTETFAFGGAETVGHLFQQEFYVCVATEQDGGSGTGLFLHDSRFTSLLREELKQWHSGAQFVPRTVWYETVREWDEHVTVIT